MALDKIRACFIAIDQVSAFHWFNFFDHPTFCYCLDCFFLYTQHIAFLCVCVGILYAFHILLCTHPAHTGNCAYLKRKVLLSQLIPKDKSNLFRPCKTFVFQKHRLLYFCCESLWLDKETNADLHLDYGMTILVGNKKVRGKKKNGKSIAHFLLFCIGILMFEEIKVDKPERSLAPS